MIASDDSTPFAKRSVITFYQFVPQCRPPVRADRSAGGTLPTRAFRYCEPVATASAFGGSFFLLLTSLLCGMAQPLAEPLPA